MKVLIINCGSSSLKYQIIDSETEQVQAKGLCERIGIDGRLIYQPAGGEKEVTEAPMPTHTEAIQMVLDALVNEKTGVLKTLDEVDAIGCDVPAGNVVSFRTNEELEAHLRALEANEEKGLNRYAGFEALYAGVDTSAPMTYVVG